MALIDKLSAIGDAIREKAGTTELMTLDEMPQAIADISSGGGKKEGYLPTPLIDGDGLADLYNDEATVIQINALDGLKNVGTLDLPNVVESKSGGLSGVGAKVINLPKLTKVAGSTFKDSNVEEINAPLMYKDNTNRATEIFRSCGYLKELNLPYYAKGGTGSFDFLGCSRLVRIEIGTVANYIGSQCISGCNSLKAFVIRRTDKIISLSSNNFSSNCNHFDGTVQATFNPNGDKDGYIYVPRDLIEEYKVATNWVALGEDRFRVLEEYTVDGTTTGAMDWEKAGAVIE